LREATSSGEIVAAKNSAKSFSSGRKTLSPPARLMMSYSTPAPIAETDLNSTYSCATVLLGAGDRLIDRGQTRLGLLAELLGFVGRAEDATEVVDVGQQVIDLGGGAAVEAAAGGDVGGRAGLLELLDDCEPLLGGEPVRRRRDYRVRLHLQQVLARGRDVGADLGHVGDLGRYVLGQRVSRGLGLADQAGGQPAQGEPAARSATASCRRRAPVHGGPWVGVACCDLHVTQVDAGIEHRGHEGVAQHVRVHPRQLHPRILGEAAPGGAVPVHPGPAGQQNGAGGPLGDRPLNGAADGRRKRTSTILPPFPRTGARGGRAPHRGLRCCCRWPRRAAAPEPRAS
jgi:hypothetical protein